MNSHPQEPLSTEERALAQRLIRLALPGEPSPALDARILAAAHDAVVQRPATQTRPRQRWPVAFGVAASLALAVGIAWQLRPLPQAPPAYDEASAAMVDSAAVEGTAQDAVGGSVAKVLPIAPPAPTEATRALPHAANAEVMQDKASSSRRDAVASATAADEPAIVFDLPQPVAVQTPQSAPPAPPPPVADAVSSPEFVPAPPAPATQSRDRNESAARAGSSQRRALSGAAAPARSAEAKDASTLGTMTAADGREEGFDERPPSTADSPEVQQAWLQRIRELIADGEPDAARDSLQEFKRRHPGVVLPDDLRRFDRPL